MRPRAPNIADLGWQVGDGACAFCNDGGSSPDDIAVPYVSKGLQAGNKCVCLIDMASSVRDRIPGELLPRGDILQFLTEDQAFPPEGVSKDTLIRGMEAMVKEAFSGGYERFWWLADATLVVRNSVDIKTWFACKAEVNEFPSRIKNPYYIPARQFLDSL